MTEAQQQALKDRSSIKREPGQRGLRLRYASAADAIAMEEFLDKAQSVMEGPKSLRGYVTAVCDAARLVLVDWSEMRDQGTGESVPYDPAKLENVLSLGDVGELQQRLLIAQSIGASDRKKSAWRLPSVSDKSASPVAPATA